MEILELIERETGYQYHPAGTGDKEFCGVCPWCGGEGGRNGKGGRFRIWPAKGTYWCRECQRQGDDIQFLRDKAGLSFQEAKARLGIADDTVRHRAPTQAQPRQESSNENAPLSPPNQTWQTQAKALLSECQAALWDDRGAKARAWLNGRGLSNETIKQAGLGYNAADLFEDRATWGLPPEKNAKGHDKKVWLPRGVVIPLDNDGVLWSMRIRRPEGDPKYVFVAGGSPNALYNADALLMDTPAAIFEGEFNALTTLQEAGDLIVPVATGSTYMARRARWLARLSLASVVLVCYDTDEDGEKAAAYWLKALPNARRWRPFWGDVNQLAQEGVSVRNWIEVGLGIRTEPAPAPVPVEQPAPSPWLTVEISDFIGATVDADTWAALQVECERRHDGEWALYADSVGENYKIKRLIARPTQLQEV